MKFIGILLVCLLATSAYSQQLNSLAVNNSEENDAKEAIQVVSGFLIGAFGSYTSIETCFDDSKSILDGFKKSIRSFKDDDFISVVDGLKTLGLTLVKIPSAVKSCRSMQMIAIKIAGLAMYFAHPSLLVVKAGHNIIWHSVSIGEEIIAAIEAHDRGDYFTLGKEIGYIVDNVLLSTYKYKENLNNDGTEFFEGFTHGIDPALYEDTKQCVDDLDQETIDKIKADLKDISWKHIDRSVKDIEDLAKIFKGIIKDCEAPSEEAEAFFKQFVKALETTNFLEAALKILKNPLKFIRMVEHIEKDLNKDDYFDAGDIIGDFVAEVLKLHNQRKVSELLKN